jgi:crotonobetainyl-CoA:carnitine CoA-transferase CaiB-like acyl-CoA transferase
MTANKQMHGPMAGVRVIDLTIAAAGPLSTAILAAQGAEVIKVERPDGGDFMRGMGAMSGGVTSTFASWNRGKRSICVDIKQAAGVDLLHRLARDADVFVHNLRPGAAEEAGIGYEQLRAINPGLVYVYLTGWGESGPRAGEPAYDSVIQAASGIASAQANPATGEPEFVRNAICDKTSGLVLSQLITAALFARARTGQGQRVHLAMLHAALSFVWPDGMQTAVFLDDTSERTRATMPPVRRTLDCWMSVSCNLDREYQALCEVLDVVALADDPRFAGRTERSRNAGALWALLDPLLAQRRTADLATAFAARRVPHAVVNTGATIADDAQVKATALMEVLHHPDAGRMRLVRFPGDFSATPPDALPLPPQLGEQTDAVLAELGLTANEIAELRASGAVA